MGDCAFWSSVEDEPVTLPELIGECMDTGAPTAPERSSGSHVVPGLKLSRLACDIAVSAVD